jgi:hypothetical protein
MSAEVAVQPPRTTAALNDSIRGTLKSWMWTDMAQQEHQATLPRIDSRAVLTHAQHHHHDQRDGRHLRALVQYGNCSLA